MIELQRAKLGLPPAGGSPSAQTHKSSPSPRSGAQSQQSRTPVEQTPQQIAAATVLSEDDQMQRFIHRLQRRDDSHPIADSSSGPTVPTALARRILQKQGVGYLDETVAAAISASADRFLATVLQQALACRDQRLKGAAMRREAARHRKRHMMHYEADADDRKRRKEGKEQAHERNLLRAIGAAESLKKGGGKNGDDQKKKSKKKKAADIFPANGLKASAADLENDEASYDSIDEEEEYYQDRVGDIKGKLKGDDYEDDDTLLLRDLVRPLQAWDFRFTGKEGLEPRDDDSDEEEGEEDIEEKTESAAPQLEENGNEEGLPTVGVEGGKTEGKQGDEMDMDTKRKSASSPVPNAS